MRLALCLLMAGCASAPVTSRPAASDDVGAALAHYRSACSEPQDALSCTPQSLPELLGPDAEVLRRHREQVVIHWLAGLAADDPTVGPGLGWLGETQALPGLRRLFLGGRRSYGWEGSDPLDDRNFVTQAQLIPALEQLSGLPLARAVALTAEERAELVREAFARAPGQLAATWLLGKLAPGLLRAQAPGDERSASPGEVDGLEVPAGLRAHLLVAHDMGGGVRSLSVLASLEGGRLASTPAARGCRLLARGNRVVPLDRGGPVALAAAPFSNPANTCVADLEGGSHPPGSFLAQTGDEAMPLAATTAIEPVRLEADALARLNALGGAGPLLASATVTSRQLSDRVIVEVELRSREAGGGALGGGVFVYRGETLLGQVVELGPAVSVRFLGAPDLGADQLLVVEIDGGDAWESVVLGQTAQGGLQIVARGGAGSTV